MPRISVGLVRCALLHLGGGFTLGALMLANKGLPGALPLEPFRPLHIEMLLFGWMVQLAFGVSAWILPFSRRVDEDIRLWAVLPLINAGVVLVGASEVGPPWLPLLGRFAEIAATALFAGHIWPRLQALSRRSVS